MRRNPFLIVLLALAVFAAACEGSGGEATPPDAPSGVAEDAAPADPDGAAPDAAEADAAGPDAAAPVDTTAADDAADVPPDVGLPPIPAAPFAAPVAAEDTTFAVGPYVMHTTQTMVTIAFETTGETAGDETPRVRYGLESVAEAEVVGELAADGAPHTVVLEGLQAESVYRYQACFGERCTAELTFATAPRRGRPFRFAVYGDSRSDPAQHRAVVDTIIESQPALVFNTGDVVVSGEREQYAEEHFNPLRRLAHAVPVYVAIGNHEWKDPSTSVKNFRDYMVYPRDPDVPRAETSYTVTWGDAFFLVMDNTMDGLDFFFPLGAAGGPPLWQWLQERSASEEAQSARWRFAFFHYPPASPCHEDWMMITAMREHVVPLLRENGFHAIFTGHVHGYERHDFAGLPAFVTGGGGAGLEDEGNCVGPAPSLVNLAVLHHHLTVDLTEDEATVRAIALDGRAFDELVLTP